MNKIINTENYLHFAHSNFRIVKKPIKGVVVKFMGLGGADIYWLEESKEGRRYAENGILYVFPYQSPWAWMNDTTIAFTEELLDVMYEEFSLPENTPLVLMGGSMGGMSALTFAAYSKRTPVACVTDCPACDLVYHYNERFDVARTMYSAFKHYDGDILEAVKLSSPIHLIDKMPKSTKYYIYECTADTLVDRFRHSEPFYDMLKERGCFAEKTIVEGRNHCDLPEDVREDYIRKTEEAILG